MPLEELNDKLHSRDVHLDRSGKADMFRPEENQPDVETLSQFQQTEDWDKRSLPLKYEVTLPAPVRAVVADDVPAKKRRKIIAVTFGSVACILLIGGILMKFRSGLFSEENITVNLVGPLEVGSAQSVSYDFEYANTNWMAASNATIIFEYPDSFRPDAALKLTVNKSRAEMTLGDIPSQGRGKVTLSGKFYGSKGGEIKLSGVLRYSPPAFKTAYEKRVERVVRLTSSPLHVEIDAPLELASDQEAQYEVRYSNPGDVAFSNLKIRLEYPAEFVFTDADQKPSQGNSIFDVDTLPAHAEGVVVVRGRLTGARDEQKLVRAEIGIVQGDGTFVAYAENNRKTKIVASPFSIHQTVNGVASTNINPGDTLSYTIEYRNEGNVGIRDAIITTELDSPYIDWSTLTFGNEHPRGGAYIQARKVILWKASDIPELSRIEPGQSGKVSFTINTYDNPEKHGVDVRNPMIRSVAKIDSPDIPAIVGYTKVVASNTLAVKMNSRVSGELLGFYQDATLPNSGPIPPVVGQETTYTFHLSLNNSTNEIKDARVSILIPTSVRYTGSKSPESEKTLFNSRTNELIWDIGVFAPDTRRTIAFQVGLTPEASMVDTEAVLIRQATVTAKDGFTEGNVTIRIDRKTTNLSEDTSIGNINYRVRAANQ